MRSNQISGEITIREVHTMVDLTATIALQKAVWQMTGEQCTSAYVQNAVIHNGGSVLCAEHDGQMIGFCFAFPAKRGDDIWLWSHMTGVLAEYQGQGIGFMLKQQQRIWALDNGYSIIGWTYDPMQRGNANFNLRQLGAIINNYYADHYGEMTDAINAGLASDRMEAIWELQNPRVVALANGENQNSQVTDIQSEYCLVSFSDNSDIVYNMPTVLADTLYYVEIPRTVSSLKQTHLSLAQEWQLTVRKAITHMLSEDYIVSGFINKDKRCWYVLTRP